MAKDDDFYSCHDCTIFFDINELRNNACPSCNSTNVMKIVQQKVAAVAVARVPAVTVNEVMAVPRRTRETRESRATRVGASPSNRPRTQSNRSTQQRNVNTYNEYSRTPRHTVDENVVVIDDFLIDTLFNAANSGNNTTQTNTAQYVLTKADFDRMIQTLPIGMVRNITNESTRNSNHEYVYRFATRNRAVSIVLLTGIDTTTDSSTFEARMYIEWNTRNGKLYRNIDITRVSSEEDLMNNLKEKILREVAGRAFESFRIQDFSSRAVI